MAPSVIHDLCERYERNRESYRSDAYNEAQARQEFINPLFKQLGWDMDNEQGYAEAYKDVVHEDSLRVGTQLKAPDYGFRIGGQRKFFLEAKKPRVSVVDSKDPAYQLRRYAWSAKLPLSVLTNFAEFAVYDCRWKPEVSDAAGKHRVEYFTYEQFETKWDYLINTFSRDAILKGSFDKYAQGMKGKRGTQEVDSEFLKEIELWREVLARNLRLRNKDMSIEELNFSVGRIIDRIIFLRVCEDRGIEEYGQLEALLKGSNVYDGLVKLFRRADERYNSGLFHFQKEKGRGEQPDTLTPGLIVDDKILKDVLRTLYYPQSPYEFRVFPADILGQVYEQFLGKVIVKSGKTVDVEEKPEVRKAGGVYYTPTYIVDYIVKHTVGKLVEGKTPDEVSKLRVLDPACGSGSFLIGAYQYLLDWHLAYYVGADGNPPASGKSETAKRKPTPPNPPAHRGGGQRIYETPSGWRLTLAERKRILLNNIYGVDIDGQAVEVTKLSLLLKVLEGANAAEVQGELALRHHALPDLSDNIKCGNSLVGPDIRKQFPDLAAEELERINPFDWQAEFKDVFKQGGFDAVIGNPPWGADIDNEMLYFHAKYPKSTTQHTNSYKLFVDLACGLTKPAGLASMIIPNSLLRQPRTVDVRKLLLERTLIVVVDLGEDVFVNVEQPTCIFVVRNEKPTGESAFDVRDLHAVVPAEKASRLTDSTFLNTIRSYSEVSASVDLEFIRDSVRIVEHGMQLGDLSDFKLKDAGINYQRTNVGMRVKGNSDLSDRLLYEGKRQKKTDKMYWKGSDINRFSIEQETERFCRTNLKDFVKENEVVHLSAKVYDTAPKILIRQTADRIIATIDYQGIWFGRSVIAVVPVPNNPSHAAEYLLGLLNSTYLNTVYQGIVREKGRVFAQVKLGKIKQLPIRTINFKDETDKSRHDKMVKLVERMLELNKLLPEQKTPGAREKMERQIAATDREIDELVYELYGLTAEEIAVVEGANKG